MTHVALDLGLRRTGIAYPGGSDTLICPAARTRQGGGSRMHWWFQTLHAALTPHYEYGVDVVVELPFTHGEHSSGQIDLIGLHAIAKLVAYNLGDGHGSANYCDVHNSTLKAFAVRTGGAKRDARGQVPKSEMVAAAIELGCLDPVDDNEADAYLIYCFWADRDVNRGRTPRVRSDRVAHHNGGTR